MRGDIHTAWQTAVYQMIRVIGKLGLSQLYVLGAVCAVCLAACGSSGKDDKTSGGEFKVALLTPGPISDQSWNGGAYQGLVRIRDSLGAHVSHIQTKTPAEFEENFRQ